MTSNLRMLLTVAVVFVACLATSISIAAADVLVMTVRITDASAIERELGTCDAGFQVRNEADSGSRLITIRGGEATLMSRNGIVRPGFYCEGRPLPMPSTGYTTDLH